LLVPPHRLLATLPVRRCRFKNLDKLIHYANQDGRLNAFYSTPAA